MIDLKWRTAFCFGIGLSLLMTACGGGGGNTTTPPTTTYTLTVNSTNPATGVAITVSPADINSAANGSTSFTRTYDAGASVTLTAPATSGSDTFASWTGCTSTSGATCTVTLNANTTVTANYTVPATTYTLTVNSTDPASGVAITNSPADINGLTGGNTAYTLTYDAGATITLTAPKASGSGSNFTAWSGCTTSTAETCSVTLNANTTVTAAYAGQTTPTVTVTPAASTTYATEPLVVTVTVSGGGATPTGSVVLTSGSYTSAAATLNASGIAQITIPASTLAAGSHTFKAAYTPDSNSSAAYNSASGTSSAVTVAAASTITVSMPSTPLAVTDQILGMNMAVWDDTSLADAVTPFQTAGIKAVRWPGGSTSDDYHWEGTTNNPSSPSICGSSYAFPNDTFADFVNQLAVPAGLDIALTADYGSDPTCTTGGLPSEAAAWVANALTLGVTVSHMTVGNENYGSWEEDLHAKQWDPTTYAGTVVGSSGFYQSIKTASPKTLVGVVVDEDNKTSGWDNTVLANAIGNYDFVEYHYYPETPGSENDSFLVNNAAQNLTANINTIKAELVKWGTPDTPIYVGEIGGPYTNPGKQSWSITQGLYAGQVLGEMMNDGVSRLTWWIGFGNCNGQAGNDTTSVYGWQDFGAYNVFSDGSTDTNCPGAGNVGTMSPTARAFQLFSNVAVNGENVLTAKVAGDTSDVTAYAATHNGGTGTALVLFNRNETVSEPVTISISGQSTATTITQTTYDKAIYDLSGSPTGTPADPAGTSTWAAPTITTITSPTLPLTVILTPWSMNVFIIQ